MTEPHDHDHDHDHDDASVHGASASMSARVGVLIAALEHKGVLRADDVDRAAHAFMQGARPENGARIVARAWMDTAFRARLLDDANAALDELAIDMSHWARVKLVALANTRQEHNLVVCTLCSCYPVGLLGPSPGWYKSAEYRARAVREPRRVLAEFGVTLPEETAIRVWDSTAELRYLVVPMRPEGSHGESEADLAKRVTRDALIGAALAK
jgi:nitrile hydratase